MSTIISVCNLKGGAGKSTLAVNLACALQENHSVDCRLVDADRQKTAKEWASKGHLPVPVGVATLLEAKPEERYPGMMWITQIKALAEECETLVIDLPPGLEYVLTAVTTVSDVIVVPVNPSGADFHATTRFIELIHKARETSGTDKPDCLIVPNRIDARTTYERDLSDYRQFGEPVAHPIHMRTAFSKGFDTGHWIGNSGLDANALDEINQLANLVTGEYAASSNSSGQQDLFST